MRLQTKLTLAFAAVALVEALLWGGVARRLVENRYRAGFRRDLDEAEAGVEREFRRAADEVGQATARVARADDPLLGPLLVALARGPLDDDQARELASGVDGQMRALGFDVLEIVDERGTVLAAAHLPGRVGDADPAALAVAQHQPGRARLVEEQVIEGGAARPILALEAARPVQARFADDARARVVVVGGRRLGAPFLERLPHAARLLRLDGAVLETRGEPSRRAPRRLVELPGGDGLPAARVEVVVPDDELVRTLTGLGWATVALGMGGLALALLVGALAAQRITGPVRDLARAARAVARGELEARVPVRTRDEVGALGDAFNAMTRDLSTARSDLVRAERIAAWREIAQRIAHEIKNPLTPIQMAIETLQRAHAKRAPQFDELFAESSRTILDEVGRLKHIVAEFSRFARLPVPRLAPVDVGEVVEAALALYAGAAPVERRLAPSLPAALADREQLTQVLLNLLENARDAVETRAAEGRIIVTTRALEARVELEVEDNGPGLSDEARARLFTPYFTTKTRGTGLGLAIVHRIVSDHGGEIRVGDAAGRGAVFTVALPLAGATPAPASP
jgi:signal transduction histidine kinase